MFPCKSQRFESRNVTIHTSNVSCVKAGKSPRIISTGKMALPGRNLHNPKSPTFTVTQSNTLNRSVVQ